MKERLNELFDVRGSRELRSYSASKPPSKNARGIESGRRLDGILKVLPGDGQWKLNYQKLRHNLMPAGEAKRYISELKETPLPKGFTSKVSVPKLFK